MPNPVKSILALGLLGVAAACAQPNDNEFVVVESEHVAAKPASGDAD